MKTKHRGGDLFLKKAQRKGLFSFWAARVGFGRLSLLSPLFFV
jgi:hypothetical protein